MLQCAEEVLRVTGSKSEIVFQPLRRTTPPAAAQTSRKPAPCSYWQPKSPSAKACKNPSPTSSPASPPNRSDTLRTHRIQPLTSRSIIYFFSKLHLERSCAACKGSTRTQPGSEGRAKMSAVYMEMPRHPIRKSSPRRSQASVRPTHRQKISTFGAKKSAPENPGCVVIPSIFHPLRLRLRMVHR